MVAKKFIDPTIRMKLNDACLQVLGCRPDQCRFAMTHTEVLEEGLRPTYSTFNFDSRKSYDRVMEVLGIRYANGVATFSLRDSIVEVRGPRKDLCVAVCARVSLMDEQPNEMFGTKIAWKQARLW